MATSLDLANTVLKESSRAGLILSAKLLIRATHEAFQLMTDDGVRIPGREKWKPHPTLGYTTEALKNKFETRPYTVLQHYTEEAGKEHQIVEIFAPYARKALGLA